MFSTFRIHVHAHVTWNVNCSNFSVRIIIIDSDAMKKVFKRIIRRVSYNALGYKLPDDSNGFVIAFDLLFIRNEWN